MPQLPILKITEIFPSIQGEGFRQGEPTLFIRFSGCNLKCSFCDTKYAWKDGKAYSMAQILNEIKKMRRHFKSQWVCLTGGEPLLQDIVPLAKGLKNEGLKIQIETNATIFRSLSVDWMTVSPKPRKYFYAPEFRKAANEVKIVVTKDLKFKEIQRLREEFPEKTPLLLQPQSNLKWSMALGVKILRQTLKADLKNIKISVQLHKILGLR